MPPNTKKCCEKCFDVNDLGFGEVCTNPDCPSCHNPSLDKSEHDGTCRTPECYEERPTPNPEKCEKCGYDGSQGWLLSNPVTCPNCKTPKPTPSPEKCLCTPSKSGTFNGCTIKPCDCIPCHASTPAVERWKELTEQMSKLGVDEWAKQGRTDEEVYAVRNFLTGIGGIRIKDLISSLRESDRKRTIERVSEFIANETVDLCENSQELKNRFLTFITNLK